VKPIDMTLVAIAGGRLRDRAAGGGRPERGAAEQLERVIGELEQKMREAAKRFEFEKAAQGATESRR